MDRPTATYEEHPDTREKCLSCAGVGKRLLWGDTEPTECGNCMGLGYTGLPAHVSSALPSLRQWELYADYLEAENEALVNENVSVAERNLAVTAEVERLREALTPSMETKAAYWGSDELECTDWTLIKEIMALIRKQAALEGKDG